MRDDSHLQIDFDNKVHILSQLLQVKWLSLNTAPYIP